MSKPDFQNLVIVESNPEGLILQTVANVADETTGFYLDKNDLRKEGYVKADEAKREIDFDDVADWLERQYSNVLDIIVWLRENNEIHGDWANLDITTPEEMARVLKATAHPSDLERLKEALA